jgi:hypothetical protein
MALLATWTITTCLLDVTQVHMPLPHPSVVSVVLTRSAAPRSRAPAAPMLLPPRLLMCT